MGTLEMATTIAPSMEEPGALRSREAPALPMEDAVLGPFGRAVVVEVQAEAAAATTVEAEAMQQEEADLHTALRKARFFKTSEETSDAAATAFSISRASRLLSRYRRLPPPPSLL